MTRPDPTPAALAADVQQPVLLGRQVVGGLWFPADWFDEGEAARRSLTAWLPGSRLFRFEAGLLLRFDAPVEMDCDRAIGWPLRLAGAVLSSAPLSAAERARLPVGDVSIVIGARAAALRLSDARPVDPSAWLEIDDYALLDTYDCRLALAPPVALEPPEPRGLRQVLGNAVPPPSPAQLAFLKELARSQPLLPKTSAAVTRGALPRVDPVRRAIARLLDGLPVGAAGLFVLAIIVALAGQPRDTRGLIGQSANLPFPVTAIAVALGLVLAVLLFRHAIRRAGRQQAAARRAQPVQARPVRQIRPRGLAGRLTPQRWRDWLARLAAASELSRLLGRRQGAYLRRLLEMFDSGDLDQALRHAIPLGGNGQSLGQAFGTPAARRALALSGQLGPGLTINLGNALNTRLRDLYRQSFVRLDRAGRIDEAVFVLAELLSARKEALDYLEKHERLAQAAELALAWDMPADLIVRLHCLLGDWQMALAVARRDNAFANAITQLTPKYPDAARRLRREWADALAARGAWLQAVDAIWPIEEAREQAAAWLRSAEAAGGDLGARGLVRRAALLPDTMSVHAETLTALRDDPAASVERNAVAEALLGQKEQSAATQRVTGLLFGAILADHARGACTLGRKELQRLVALARDPILAADLPGGGLPSVTAEPLAQRTTLFRPTVPERGTQAILDAVPLDTGRYLLAIGEAGALLVDRFGTVLRRFAVPCHKLVIAESRQIALALARRDSLWRVSRIDLANREVTDLGMLACTQFAGEFDGLGWTVAMGDRLCVLDTARGLRHVLWQVSELPGPILALTRTPTFEQILVEEGLETLSLWRYVVPQRRLVTRDELLPKAPETQFRALDPYGGYLEGRIGPTDSGVQAVHLQRHKPVRSIPLRDGLLDPDTSIACFANGGWTLLRFTDAAGRSVWQLIPGTQNRVVAEIDWPAAPGTGLRMIGADWLFFDQYGRALHLDIESSRVASFALR